MITTIAPAKINWTLEVLGRRDDGYHELRTVMQTVELCDELSVDAAEDLTIARNVEYAGDGEDLVERAAVAMATEAGREPAAAIRVTKRIPVGAGLGGGSSDAAATLRALSALWGVDITPARLADVAARTGSDVPFFLRGGTALVEGRGERVTSLADVPPVWLVVLVPPLSLAQKTKRMYATLTAGDFTDGSCIDAFIASLEGGRPLDAPLFNAFERAAYVTFEGLAFFRDALVEAGARAVCVCGAGPALFCVANGEQEARAIQARVSRVRRGEKIHVVRTLAAAESMAMWSAADGAG
ncbi:MAG: 4-(cytidine 5'-diphospho)-2-C-methyl-D-erythritol kinase [Dehalococcoidia bacterium]